MTSVTQSIDTYHGGISLQPDLKKLPGQVKDIVNAVPDVTEGLYKRPGAKRISPAAGQANHDAPLPNVQSNGSWFHYFRDETEGSYIGQIASDGKVRMWSCNDGTEKDVWYHTDDSQYSGGNSDHTAITSYLTPSGATATEDLQALTINDTTFLNNRTKTVGTTGTTTARPDTHFAYIELLRTENGRQYPFNVYTSGGSTSDIKRATRIHIESDTLTEGTGSSTCPGIGTQVFSVSDTNIGSFGANAVSATFTSSDANGLTNNKITVTYNNHGLRTGDQIKITGNNAAVGGGFTNQTKHAITRQDANTFYYITTSNEGDHTNQGCTIESPHAGKKNLIFRIRTTGQTAQSASSSSTTPNGGDYECSYTREVTLLHGGEGWEVGDSVGVNMTAAKAGFDYKITVQDSETLAVKADIKAARPAPTPFDADTAVTMDAILGSMKTEIAGISNLSSTVIGNGIYITFNSAFNVTTPEKDLMRVMQSEINDVSNLPTQCKHGYIVKVTNSQDSGDDDYYLKFVGENNTDGPGSWEECAEPGIVKSLDATTMPHVLQRQADGAFLVKKYTWEDREVGDNNTNALPTFVGKKINRVLFFRNRLALLAGENVILSRPGELTTPSFFAKTALAVSAVDPIDISCSSTFPSDLFDGIETAAGLAVFSTNQQFLLSSDAEILNPDTAKLRSISTYNYNEELSPISLGTTIGYVDNSGKYSRFNEMANVQREQEPVVAETSKLVSSLLPKNLDLLTNSRENQLVLFGKTNTDIVYGYKYLTFGEERRQQAWFKWKLNNPIKYHFIINDEYFLLDTDNFLQKINLMQQETDPSIDETVGSDTSNYLIHLDNWTTVGNGSYNTSTKITTFANQSDWIDQVTTPNGTLVLVDTDEDATRVGRYAECTVTNTDDFTVPGNWEWSEEHTFAHTSINAGNEQITLTSGSTDHGLKTGDLVKYVKGDTVAAGLTDGTNYYVIDASINNIALATSLNNANAGVAVNITGQGTGTHKVQKLITTLYIGYLYEYSVHFPTIYMTKAAGQRVVSDVSASLVLHRVKLNFGKSGLYTTTLQRTAPKPNYSETYEAAALDEYNVSDAPYVPENIQTVPVYEKNDTVEVVLKSTHPAPATFHSLSWEGDYTPKNYRRV